MASKCRTAPIEWFVERAKEWLPILCTISVSCASIHDTNCPATWFNLNAPTWLRISGLPDNPPVGWVLRNPDKVIPLYSDLNLHMLYAWCFWLIFLCEIEGMSCWTNSHLIPVTDQKWQWHLWHWCTFHLKYSHLFLTFSRLTELHTYYSLLQASELTIGMNLKATKLGLENWNDRIQVGGTWISFSFHLLGCANMVYDCQPVNSWQYVVDLQNYL